MATPGNLGSSVLASKTKTKKKHFVAQKVKLFRASDPLLSVLMWGVNHSLLRGGEPEPGPRPSGCSPSGAARPPRRLCPPSLAHACPSGPLGPPLDLGPESGRQVPSAWEPCGRYQCRPPSVRPSVDLCPQPGNWEVFAGTARRGCEPQRGRLGSETRRSLPSAGCGGGGSVLRRPAGVPVPGWERPEPPRGGIAVRILEIGETWTEALVLRSFFPLKEILLDTRNVFDKAKTSVNTALGFSIFPCSSSASPCRCAGWRAAPRGGFLPTPPPPPWGPGRSHQLRKGALGMTAGGGLGGRQGRRS
ncbi:Phosphatidylinositol-5-phosphate 4-kinase type-2 alpha [Pteropus alecto]|uniref:Phosphatidylinositol-5-phosphate 4-kinase type-2 alpha n=1 Tax=Pteropus alecto TaxID=9402 RepID=L5L022_PTEAL|nr:Phosphatidylinositol-5-phosphate 4-kinase type-2 alpha [Pteropus alecto]